MAGYVPGFEHDIFISYAHLDNKQSKWVESFCAAVEDRLAVDLGCSVQIWRDKKLDGLDKFNDSIAGVVRQSAIFAAIISPSYVQSKFCLQELSWFLGAISGALEVPDRSRVARIRKMKLAAGLSEPAALRPEETLGFPFFDEANPSIEFEARPATQDAFDTQVKRVAAAAARVLQAMRARAQQKSPGRTVFLAESTAGLVQSRASVKEELEALGHKVVPAGALLSNSTLDTGALEAALSASSYAVHLFGDAYGLVPEGSELSLPHAQYERAAALGLPQIVWVKPGQAQPRQEIFLKAIRDSAVGDQRRLDLCETAFADFTDALRDVLTAPEPAPPPPETPTSLSSVYLLAPEEDLTDQGFRALRRALVNSGFPVDVPVFEALPGELRSIEEKRILANDATIIYYGTARDAWIDQKRKFVINSLGKTPRKGEYWRAVYVSPPKTAIKEMLFGDYLGASIPEDTGLTPLLVIGDFEPFSHDKLGPLLASLARKSNPPPSLPPVSSAAQFGPGPSSPSAPPAPPPP